MDRYEAWKKFCDDSDRLVKEFNSQEQLPCPFCGGKAEMHWNYDGDYDPMFLIECDTCGCSVRTSQFETCVTDWGRRIGNGNIRK